MSKRRRNRHSKEPSYRKYDDVIVEQFKNNPELADYCLCSAFNDYKNDKDKRFLLIVLRQVAQARGISNIAKDTGITRQAVHKALSERGNPRFLTFMSIVQSLGYALSFKHIKHLGSH